METHNFLSQFFLSIISFTLSFLKLSFYYHSNITLLSFFSPPSIPAFILKSLLLMCWHFFLPSDFSLLYVLLLSLSPFVPFFSKTRTNLTIWILQYGDSCVACVPQWRWRKQESLWGRKQGKVHFEEAICPSGCWLICWRLPVTQSVWSNWFFNNFLSGEKQTCWIDFDEVVDQKDCFVSEESQRRGECFSFIAYFIEI